jgi:hypothetical protein
MYKRLALIAILCVAFAAPAYAAEEVGSVVQLRGSAQIDRAGDRLDAIVKNPIELKDFIETQTRSRAKMLFVDDSMLTLASKSRASIEKFVYSQEGGGASVFNLLDGKMRAIVGKTKFEVHTPTAVAAARGTVILFEVGIRNGKPYTTITCLEGEVEVKSSDPSIEGVVILYAGQTITIYKGEALPEPRKVNIARVDKAEDDGTGKDKEDIEEENVIEETVELVERIVTTTAIIMPPIEREPVSGTSITIGIDFP